jgi:hypothetical protein
MSALPVSERLAETLDSGVLQLGDDDMARAVCIYRRACDEAQRCDVECAQWLGVGRAAWREPQAGTVLHRRTVARARARVAFGWLLGQALHDWRPSGEGH